MIETKVTRKFHFWPFLLDGDLANLKQPIGELLSSRYHVSEVDVRILYSPLRLGILEAVDDLQPSFSPSAVGCLGHGKQAPQRLRRVGRGDANKKIT